jgi:predicted nucleotidyltransferase
MLIKDQLTKILPEILANFPSILVMYLFGSHASGKPRGDSDVDIAVFTDGSETPTMDLELGVFLQHRLKRPINVVILQKVSPILQHEILRKKGRIFEKSRACRAFLENQSFRAYLDACHYQQKRALWRKSNGQHRHHTTAAE